MDKKKIKLISIAAAVAAVIIAGIIALSVNYTRIQIDVMYKLMPDYIDGSFDDVNPVRVYKRRNPDFDYKTQKDDPLAAYEFYFYDEDGEEVSVVGGEVLEIDGEEIGMLYGDFLPQLLENWGKLQNKLIITGVIAAIVIITGLIILWFVLWSKKQDAQKAKKYGNKPSKKKKKSRK